jgi:peptidylprolyl isomerase
MLNDSASASALLNALDLEQSADVRLRMLEALGRSGDAASLERLLDLAAAVDARGYALALFGFGRRGMGSPKALPVLLSLLSANDTVAQELAALTLASPRAPALWGVTVPQLRSALDACTDASLAAGALVVALARADDPTDVPRLLSWLNRGARWRTRVQAAQSLSVWADRPEVSAELLRALEDSSIHVAMTAARVLTDARAPSTTPAVRAWIEANTGRWSVASLLLPAFAVAGDTAFVLGWSRTAVERGAPRWVGYAAFAQASDMQSLESLLAGLSTTDRRELYAATEALGRRLARLAPDAPQRDRIAAAVADRLQAWGPYATGSDLRGPLAVLEATAQDMSSGAAELHARAATHPHASMRAGARASAKAPTRAVPSPALDWEWLRARGPHPRLRFETLRGRFVVELDVEAAPLTALTVLRFVDQRRYDGLTFHRVEANFILQSGDFDGVSGAGGPDAPIRTEITHIPFVRGTVGMASAGRDTEGSQFFITHGTSPSLDGRYTPFGRVVSGMAVADAIALGDRLVRVSIE